MTRTDPPFAGRTVQAVFFDIGGPIYDDENFATAVLAALDDLLAEQGRPPADRARFRAVYDGVRAAQSGSLRRALAAEFLGDERRRDDLHARTRRYWRHGPGTLHPDVLPCLRALHGRVRIGALANQEADVLDALRRDGVAPFIQVWAVSALVGHEKPDPALFEWAVKEAGTSPANAVHVGNRLDTDVRPARALGLGTVWVLRGEAPPEPTAEQLAEPDVALPDLRTLPRLLLGTRPGDGDRRA
ncbi:HAD family hydrolase [Micromonospora sp. NPDC023966]|uniref:HAD family hydrolase n=1 Tax=Micromonospora sp. NPDC023966 TaxID=3154699 RepID=UPI0033C0932C